MRSKWTMQTLALVMILQTVILPAAAQVGLTKPALTLADLERMALEASPSIRQSATEVRAAEGRAKQAGMYPNPTLGVDGDHVSGGPVQRGGELGGFVEQRIVTGGKLGLSRKAAMQTRIASEKMQEAERLRVLTSIRTLYYRALGEQRLIGIRKEMAESAGQTVKTWRERANLGQLDQPDVIAAEVEQQRAALSVKMAQHALERTWNEISALAGQAIAPSTLEGDFESLPKLEAETALAKIYAGSPELLAAEANRAGADRRADRARAEIIPDIMLRGGVRHNRELRPDGITSIGQEGFFDVGVEVPLFNRNQGAVAAARAEAESAGLESRRKKLSLARRFAAVYQEYRDAADAAEQYREPMIPKAQQAYKMYLENFKQMAAPHAQVLMTQRNLFELEEQYAAALMTAWRSAVEIEGLLETDDSADLKR